jgi:hypothetical protein
VCFSESLTQNRNPLLPTCCRADVAMRQTKNVPVPVPVPDNGNSTGTRQSPSRPATSSTIVPETTEGFALQPGAFGIVLVALVGGAIALLMSLAGGDDESDRLVTGSVATAPPITFDASIDVTPTTVRDLSITDEPIVIDADGNIVDVRGGNGGEVLPSEPAAAEDVSELELPDDVYTGISGDAVPITAATITAATGNKDGGTNLFGGDDPEDKRMPNLICRGLQAAQDEIQDRNWVVVAQDREPGEKKISEFEAILYVVKKSDDENTCD